MQEFYLLSDILFHTKIVCQYRKLEDEAVLKALSSLDRLASPFSWFMMTLLAKAKLSLNAEELSI